MISSDSNKKPITKGSQNRKLAQQVFKRFMMYQYEKDLLNSMIDDDYTTQLALKALAHLPSCYPEGTVLHNSIERINKLLNNNN